MTNNQAKTVSVAAADPTALGLFGLAMVTLVASSQKLGITAGTSYLIPWVIFLGAFAQLFACINDSKRNNTFGTTAFGAYSLFWFAIGTTWLINLGAFGPAFAKVDVKQLAIAFVGYLIFSLFMTVGSAKVSKVLFSIFFFINILFIGLVLSTLGMFEPSSKIMGGVAELVISILSFYGSAASVLNNHFGKVVLPVGSPFVGVSKPITLTQNVVKEPEQENNKQNVQAKPFIQSEFEKHSVVSTLSSWEPSQPTKVKETNIYKELNENSATKAVETQKQEFKFDAGNEKKNFLTNIILSAFSKNASDIYFDEYQGLSRIRYKINGIFETESLGERVNHFEITKQIFENAKFNNNKHDIIQEGALDLAISGKHFFKLSVMILPGNISENVVLTFLTDNKPKFSLEVMGMGNEDIESVKYLIDQGEGIIFVSSSNKISRKSTYYALLNEIRLRKSNIFSMEKNITCKQTGITQLELNEFEAPLIEKTLKNIGEFSADVIAVDYENSSAIMKSLANFANQGKLIIITTGYQSAYETISGMFQNVNEFQSIQSTIKGVISQKTLMTICKKCNDIVLKDSENSNTCSICGEVGSQKNITVFEVIKMKPDFMQLVHTKDNNKQLKEAFASEKGSYGNNIAKMMKNFKDFSSEINSPNVRSSAS